MKILHLLPILLFVGCTTYQTPNHTQPRTPVSPSVQTVPAAAPASPANQLPELAEKILPAVVSIANEQGSLGSGFVIQKDGYIVTARRVIQTDKPLTVVLGQQLKFEAAVTAVHTNVDLALLKIKTSEPLPVLRLCDTSKIKLGQQVVAAGNPFGLGPTMTSGIISSLGHTTGEEGLKSRLIQTDAAINPGNSGGPLCNMRGEVVGVASSSLSGGYGIGFIVPIHFLYELITPKQPSTAKTTADSAPAGR